MLANPTSFPSNIEATPNQIRTLRMKRFEPHEALLLLFNLPGVIKTELSRRAYETEYEGAFMLQLLYQAMLLSTNLVRNATKGPDVDPC